MREKHKLRSIKYISTVLTECNINLLNVHLVVDIQICNQQRFNKWYVIYFIEQNKKNQ
jgi:hypothetical protein